MLVKTKEVIERKSARNSLAYKERAEEQLASLVFDEEQQLLIENTYKKLLSVNHCDKHYCSDLVEFYEDNNGFQVVTPTGCEYDYEERDRAIDQLKGFIGESRKNGMKLLSVAIGVSVVATSLISLI